MSKWTFVNGSIVADTLAKSTEEALYIATMVCNHLPEITGSESGVKYNIKNLDFVSYSSNVNEFGQCDKRRKFYDFKTIVTIDMFGALRDRTFERTVRETSKMLSRISSRLLVEHCVVSVRDDYGKSFVFFDPIWVIDGCPTDWVSEKMKL